MSLKVLILVIASCLVATMAAPQGIVTQQVRLPNLDSAHIAVQRLGGNFAYTVADSGPVHGLVHYAAVPSVRYVPLSPTGLAFSQQGGVVQGAPAGFQLAGVQQQGGVAQGAPAGFQLSGVQQQGGVVQGVPAGFQFAGVQQQQQPQLQQQQQQPQVILG